MTQAVPFPETLPPGYSWFDDEPTFDASVHLALESPTEIIRLTELGYTDDEIATKATDAAVSSPFRVLSDEGAAAMLDVSRRLRELNAPAGDRIERVTRGGCYRSKFLRDLCLSPEITDTMSAIYGIDVAPHPMAMHLGHLNFEPSTPETPVDKWHHDTLPLDFVLMVSDPASLDGGHFEWFRGTKHEMSSFPGGQPPADRVEAPDFPGPGYAIALHGDMVIHRGAALNQPGERITMVNGYVGLDTSVDEQSRTQDLVGVDDPDVLYMEWARHVAWRGSNRLHDIVESIEFGTDANTARTALAAAIEDVTAAIAQMDPGAERPPTFHYEK